MRWQLRASWHVSATVLTLWGCHGVTETPQHFPATQCIHDCRKQLQILYNAGARKFIVFGLSAIEQLPVINVANRVVNTVDSGKSMQMDGVLAYARRLSVRFRCC